MQFSPLQRNLVFQALDEAEERIKSYYCIPPFKWQQLRYDLLTREDREWEPLPSAMLARVRYLQEIKTRQSYDFYRIELNDPSILTAAERESLTKDLYLFLVFILTHEMVHLVRLSIILDDWIKLAAFAESEEWRVQDISRQILTISPEFRPVLKKFYTH